MRGVVSTLETDSDKLVAKARSIPRWMELTSRKSSAPRVLRLGNWRAFSSADEVVGVKDEPARFHVVAYRLRHQAEHSAQTTWRRLQGHGSSGADSGGRRAGAEADGVFLSNGPGDPQPWHLCGGQHSRVSWGASRFRDLPGHRYRDCSGGKTFKLRFWTSWRNHPVKQLHSEERSRRTP